MHLTRRVRLYPTAIQERQLRQVTDAVRYIWNHYLEKNQTYYNISKSCGKAKFYSRFDMNNALPILKKNNPWLALAPASALQYVCQYLSQALMSAGKSQDNRRGFPKFKPKHKSKPSFSVSNVHSSIRGQYVKVANLGEIPFRGSAGMDGRHIRTTISMDRCGHWYASLTFDIGEVEEMSLVPSDVVMGCDMGVSHLITTSDGEKYENKRFSRKSDKRIKRLQRQLSRSKKGSKRREKKRLRLARAHRRVANQRNNHIHEVTSRVIAKSDAISLEDLNVKGMASGKNPRKSGLRRALFDAALGEVLRQLRYKAELKGIPVFVVNRFFPSSQLCSECGNRQKMSLHVREYECVGCGVAQDRDLNAALNISQVGQWLPELGSLRDPDARGDTSDGAGLIFELASHVSVNREDSFGWSQDQHLT